LQLRAELAELARFEQEAHAAARLRSTHIVHINDYGIDDASGQPYIAMDLLEGESLQQRMDREGRLPFSEVQHILAQVAQGLELAHSKGIVHRDLKLENIFLAREGGKEVVKALDFGIAKHLHKRETSALLRTGDGQVLGTPYYMSHSGVAKRARPRFSCVPASKRAPRCGNCSNVAPRFGSKWSAVPKARFR
jgi:eukaryotic-like serine/threonine-protein kinase